MRHPHSFCCQLSDLCIAEKATVRKPNVFTLPLYIPAQQKRHFAGLEQSILETMECLSLHDRGSAKACWCKGVVLSAGRKHQCHACSRPHMSAQAASTGALR